MASTRSIGSLFIDIEARTAKMETDLARTKTLLQNLNGTVTSLSNGFTKAFGLAKAAVGIFASVETVKKLEELTMRTMDQMRAQMALSQATGLAVNDLTTIAKATEFLGVTNVDLAKTMKALYALQDGARQGNAKQISWVKRMQLDIEDFKAAEPMQLVEMVVGGMNKIANASQRNAFATEMFGKQSQNLGVLFSNGAKAIEDARKEVEAYNLSISTMDTAKVQIALKSVDELDARWQGFKQRLTVGLTPLIYTISTKLSALLQSIDIEALANTISHYVLMIGGFVLTIPDRVRVMLLDIKQMWYNFVAGLGIKDGGLLASVFGSSGEAKAKSEEIQTTLDELHAKILVVGDSLEKDFMDKVVLLMDELNSKMHMMSTTVDNSISPGMKEMVHTFSTSFTSMADLSSKFIQGESVKFGDFFRELVGTMVATFMKVSLLNPIMNQVFGNMMGGAAGGWWQALPAMAAGGGGNALFARGGSFMAGDTAVVGENGPEVVQFGRSGYVTPTDRLINRSGSGTGSDGMTINIPMTFQPGVSHQEFAAAVPMIMQQTKAAVADGVQRGGRYAKAFSRNR